MHGVVVKGFARRTASVLASQSITNGTAGRSTLSLRFWGLQSAQMAHKVCVRARTNVAFILGAPRGVYMEHYSTVTGAPRGLGNGPTS